MTILTSGICNKAIKISLYIFMGFIINQPLFAQEKELIVAIATKDSLYGIIDTSGEWYIPNTYIYIHDISEGFAQAAQTDYNTEGFIHLKSKTFIPFEDWNKGLSIESYENLSVYNYTYLYKIIDGYNTIYKSCKYFNDSLALLCHSYDTIYKPNYTFVNGIAPVWVGPAENLKIFYENGKWGYIDKNGKWILEPKYDIGRLANKKFLLAIEGNSVQYYDILKKKLIKTPYNSGSNYSEDYAVVGITNKLTEYFSNFEFPAYGKWGYINYKQEIVIPLNFKLALSFSQGLALVCKNDKYGYISNSGELKIPYQFDWGTSFYNERAGVEIDSLWGVIDRDGKWIIKPKFTFLSKYSYGLAAADYNEKSGYVDTNGSWVIPPVFESTKSFCNANQKNCIDCLSPVEFFVHTIEYKILEFYIED